jgi:hypothetical protein
MKQLTAQQKHDILIHCEHRQQGESEVDIAALHGATVTRETIWKWRQRWNHTPHSLEHKGGAGRPRILTREEVSRHVRAPILAANRSHTAVSSTKILPLVRQKTRKKIALRTLQQVGKEQLQAKSRTTRKRTKEEGQCTHTTNRAKE